MVDSASRKSPTSGDVLRTIFQGAVRERSGWQDNRDVSTMTARNHCYIEIGGDLDSRCGFEKVELVDVGSEAVESAAFSCLHHPHERRLVGPVDV